MPSLAATIASVLLLIAVLFQLALASGAPWGQLAMGGKFPGKFPIKMRIAAVVQSLVLFFLATIVLVRDGFWLPEYYQASTTAIWVVVGIFTLALIMNLATSSKWERAIWAPIAAGILISTVIVGFSINA